MVTATTSKMTASMVFQRLIYKALKRSTLSQNAIARRSGVHQPILSRFLKGQQELSVPSAERLGELFGVEEPEDSPGKELAERIIPLLVHMKAAVEFIDEQITTIPRSDPLRKFLIEHRRELTEEVIPKMEYSLRAIDPELAEE
jgi:transcriptional regulator with XRE-family HTH domain